MVGPEDKAAGAWEFRLEGRAVTAIFAQFTGLSTSHGHGNGHNLQHNLKDLP
ncbi:MAG: hypothetical protein Q8O29_07950 [Polaromonas sp.]|uniref:hypothetical protein n=1 Tax=Polaromonas sp. TaxID=1869339 RepID=UPI0027335870|nr:hypothetical protein [Polaromonas sp.]MDP2818200.1 hypothetical protein [Polaromonas sp.]